MLDREKTASKTSKASRAIKIKVAESLLLLVFVKECGGLFLLFKVCVNKLKVFIDELDLLLLVKCEEAFGYFDETL